MILFFTRARSRALQTFAPLLAAASAAGCAGSGASSPGLPQSHGSAVRTAQVRLTFTFPSRGASAAHRRTPAYVSPSIAALTVTISQGASPGTTTTIAAPPAGSPPTVTTTVAAPVGVDTFAFSETDAKGVLLGRTTQQNTVVDGTLNTFGFTLDGNLASIRIAPASPVSPFVEGSLAAGFTLVGNLAIAFVATPLDADGNTIVSPGNLPQITVASASAGVVVYPNASDTFSLAAPAPVTTPVKITATGKDLDGNPISASANVSALAAIYVANFTTQSIGVYDENGTAIPVGTAAFAGLMNPAGIAYVPSKTPGITGTLAITNTQNVSGGNPSPAPVAPVMTFDQSGMTLPLGAAAFANTAQPLFLSYANVGGTDEIAVPNYSSSTVGLYDPTGGALAAPGGFTGLAQPVQAVYDPNADAKAGAFFVTNLGSFTLNKFRSDGTAVGKGVAAGNHTMGVAYDSNNNRLYVAYSGQVATVSTSMASPAGIAEFDETPAAVSTTGTFANSNTSAAYTGIVFDPFLKRLLVADAGTNSIVAFTEAGAAVTLPAGAFAKLSDPMSLAIVP